MKFLNVFLSVQLLSSIAFAQTKFNPIINPSGLPIKPGRTIKFTTKEASWIDVDVSPDGKTLVCSFLGDLYSIPATGGNAKQLTRGLAINRCPVWSPNGKYIAYLSDADGFIRVHIMDTTRSFHKVLGETGNQLQTEYVKKYIHILWQSDKKIIANKRIYDLFGANYPLPKDMKQISGVSCDGRFLYGSEQISNNSSALTMFDTLTGEKSRLIVYDKPLYKLNMPMIKISPDGNCATYVKYHNLGDGIGDPTDSLMLVDLKTGKEKLLAHLGIKFPGYIYCQNYSFSKDSKYLFIGYGGRIHRLEINTGKNETIPFTLSVNVDMGSLNYNTFKVTLDSLDVKYIRSAQKSPDGKQLVFSALNKIYVLDLPNGKPHILVEQPFSQFQPSYSPDGKWIVYTSWSDTQGGHLWLVSSTGGKAEQISSEAGLYLHPAWSPDAKMIVVAKGANKLSDAPYYPGVGQIEVIILKDKAMKFYADTVPLFNNPKFSEDNKQVIYKPNQQDCYKGLWPKLVSLDLETKTKSVLATGLNKDEYVFPIKQILISPDYRYLVFMYNGDLYLNSMTNIRSPQMIFDEDSFTTVIRFSRGGVDANWEGGGKVLTWVSGNHYYSINPDKIIEAATHLEPNKTLEGLPQTKIIDVDIPADQTISIHLKVPRLYGKGIVALKNVRIITIHGNDVIDHGTILIKNGRFVSIGSSDIISIPKDAEVFDLKGKTIIPGLIDMHGHIGSACPPDVFHIQSWEQLLSLSYGVTTLRDPGGSIDQFGYGELGETGQTLEPRVFSVGGWIRPNYNLTSLKEAGVIVNNRVIMGVICIKQYTQPTRLQRQLLLEACKRVKVNMTNEVEKEPLYCIGQIKDGSTGVEHNPVWGEVYDDVIKLVAKSGTYLCPTLQVCYGFQEAKHYFHKLYGQDFINKSFRFMSDDYRKMLLKDIQEDKLDTGFLQQSRIDARIKHAGGKIVMGAHGEDKGIGSHWEIWALQMGGLTNMEALQTATITAAEALGMQKDLGSIEVGKIADLIILDKNPLEDIHNTNTIKYVMKAGVLYDSETLDEIWPEKKKCPEWRMKSVNK